jgi:anion-transporting  ArsA/GET3 family ATPase
MQSLLDRKLLLVTGKGGVGKSTVAAALGLAGARSGRRTIVVEVGQESRMPEMFAVDAAPQGTPVDLAEGLQGITIDPERAILEWLQSLGGRVPGRLIASSGTFQYFAAAAPGSKELVTMVKIWQLTRDSKRTRRGASNDLVVVDAPSTGHALALLASPQTFGAIARVGPIAGQTREVEDLLRDPERSGYVAVALASEMAVTEAMEIQEGLKRQLGRDLSAVIVNGVLPKRFTAAELGRIEALRTKSDNSAQTELRTSAAVAARAVHERARLQQNQLARVRRGGLRSVSVPFIWDGRLDSRSIGSIAERLGRSLLRSD